MSVTAVLPSLAPVAAVPVAPTPAAHGHAPNAIRLALGAPTSEQVESGLRTLAALLRTQEQDFNMTE